MGNISDLPPELFEQILVLCDLRQILRCKAVSRSFNEYITHSARLTYRIDLFVSGFDDTHLSARYDLQDRRAILSAAQRVWHGVDSMALLKTLHVSNLEYWPIRDSVLLRRVAHNAHGQAADGVPVDDGSVRFDVSQISSRLDSVSGVDGTGTRATIDNDENELGEEEDVLAHWTVRLPKETGSIACIDAAQDLLVVRYHSATGSSPTDSTEHTSSTTTAAASTGQWYSLSIHSLRTGEPHPRATGNGRVEFRMSQRVTKNPHYTRVQVLDNVLAVNMASGFQLFTETAFFDWTTGELKGMFCSPGTSARAWGHPAVLVSDKCFLQPCYSSAERRPAIEVYVLDDSKELELENGQRQATHVATYWLPRVNNGDVRLIINITSRQQVSPPSPSSSSHSPSTNNGFLLSSSYARMLHIQVTGVWFSSPFQCAFFTPAHQFIDEPLRFLSLPPSKRALHGVRSRPWETWGNTSTRWLEKSMLEAHGGEGEGGWRGAPAWHEEAKSNLRGSGSRYAFSKHLVDFSPLEVAREVHRYRYEPLSPTTSRPSSLSTSTSPSQVEEGAVFASTDAPGWTTHYHRATKSQISGAEMFDEDIVSSLPYREKEIGELAEFELGSDVLLVNDKIVTVQGGVLDVIKIYKPVASPSSTQAGSPRPDDGDTETDDLVAALAGITLDG